MWSQLRKLLTTASLVKNALIDSPLLCSQWISNPKNTDFFYLHGQICLLLPPTLLSHGYVQSVLSNEERKNIISVTKVGLFYWFSSDKLQKDCFRPSYSSVLILYKCQLRNWVSFFLGCNTSNKNILKIVRFIVTPLIVSKVLNKACRFWRNGQQEEFSSTFVLFFFSWSDPVCRERVHSPLSPVELNLVAVHKESSRWQSQARAKLMGVYGTCL